jgi:adenylylsulfate kinase
MSGMQSGRKQHVLASDPCAQSALVDAHEFRTHGVKLQTVWLTGLSGSGKTTIATAAMRQLAHEGLTPVLLDGDALRQGLNSDLGYSETDRFEAVRRVAEMARVFNQHGALVFVSMISPTLKMREMARRIIGVEFFMEVYVDTPLTVCEERDVKGLYRKARLGLIPEFTGVSATYESPLSPGLHLRTEGCEIHECTHRLVEAIRSWSAASNGEAAHGEVENSANARDTDVAKVQ